MNLYTIETGLFKLDGGAMFGVVPKSIWQKTNPADSNNLCSLAMRSLLIEDGDRLILVDTGIGNKQSEKFFSYYHLDGEDTLQKSLAKNGFHPDDITDVLLTHLHLDHVGGAVALSDRKLSPAFKNAIYWTNSKHWNWAINPNDREKASFLKENILPLQESGQLQYIDQTEAGFPPDIQIKMVSGHTDSMMLPQVRWKNRTIVFTTDLIPTAGHMPVPYVAGYDVFPLQSMAEKKDFLQEGFSNDYVLIFQHDALTECCTVTETEKGIRIAETFKLEEL
ncbi:MBL fold metallo-hydrolase [Pedobacter sp. SYSU D00535]|uniref:MBL fold metallo-hydrolase n=1 Tax=Pedobacter sp. SYSU D00535 TaxID=2810308 RepID=UPI001A96431F|nr:MBL fold metallo-hydrolase [Pedobacter sp. SYSU D00535]